MNKLKALIKQGESNTVEFKTSTAQLKSSFETICAFLNGKGGTVLIGINNEGEIVGQHVTDATRQEIAREINKLEPEALLDI
jgi:ATP-dependent DNA helicase RecG